MKILLAFSLMIILFSIFSSCNTTEPTDGKDAEPDSTTQNFTFETYEFGDGYESCWLNDVWIFDENNIWAVGYVNDIVTNNETKNIIRWNGEQWYGFGDYLTTSGLTGIWALDTSNIYLASGTLRKYENGVIRVIDLTHLSSSTGQGINRLWGSGENNIWGVGPNSTIVHYDGSSWSKIDFEEGWRFDAITGSSQTGIAYASATSQQFNTVIVELKDNTATTIYNSTNSPDNLTSFSIKLLNEQELILASTKVWTFNINTKETEVKYSLPSSNYVSRSALASDKDIYFFAKPYDPGEDLIHYNGKRYSLMSYSDRSSVIYGGAYAIKDLAVITGESNNKGYLVKVKRAK